MFEIESNIPMSKKLRKQKYPFAEMEVGDSFFAASEGPNAVRPETVRAAANMYARRVNDAGGSVKFATRTDERDGTVGVRVHRVA